MAGEILEEKKRDSSREVFSEKNKRWLTAGVRPAQETSLSASVCQEEARILNHRCHSEEYRDLQKL